MRYRAGGQYRKIYGNGHCLAWMTAPGKLSGSAIATAVDKRSDYQQDEDLIYSDGSKELAISQEMISRL